MTAARGNGRVAGLSSSTASRLAATGWHRDASRRRGRAIVRCMDSPRLPGDPDPLEGIDDVPWDKLDAAGPASEVPRLLRLLVNGYDEDEDTEDPVEELGETLCNSGTVYSATVYAVPFLVSLASAGIEPVGMLRLAAWSAECDSLSEGSVNGLPPYSVRAAVSGEAGVIVRLLKDHNPDVREHAADALGQSRTSDARVFPALASRLDTETEPRVQAFIIRALTTLDPARILPVAHRVTVSDRDPAVRLVAVTACVKAGRPWCEELDEAVTEWLVSGGADLRWLWWPEELLLGELLTSLAARGDVSLALDLAVCGLTESVAPGIRQHAVWAAGHLAKNHRIDLPVLAAALRRAQQDPEVGQSSLLGDLGLGPRVVPPLPGTESPPSPTEPLPTLDELKEGLRPCRHRVRSPQAFDQAATLGESAKPLLPDLVRHLDSYLYSSQAVRAVLRIDPRETGGVPPRELADYLVTAVGRAARGYGHKQALATLREIDPADISPQARERLRQFAERTERVVRSGDGTSRIRDDEELRVMVRQFLREIE